MKTTIHAEDRGTEATQTIPSQFNRSAVGAAALGAVFALPVAVDAAVVYSGPQNIAATLAASQRFGSFNLGSGAATAAVGLDLDGDSVDDFNLGVSQFRNNFNDHGGEAELVGLGTNQVALGAGGAEGGGPAFNFPNSSFVGPNGLFGSTGLLRHESLFNGTSPTTSGDFVPSATGYAGVRFDIAGSDHFGWIRLLVEEGSGSFPYKVTAIDWAYNDVPGAAIHVGVPEITTEVPEANPGLVLLAAGGTGLVAWRLRRRRAAQQTAQV